LLALTDPIHVHHGRAIRWFEEVQPEWATCPITENGFVRVLSHPTYPGSPGGVDAVLEILRAQTELSGWHFWSDDVSIRGILEPNKVTPSQVTDLYLLALAAHNGGKLATLDARIAAGAVIGGLEALAVIPA
jgi:toxin-antitoxin system PIN domain toxin